MTLDVHSCTSVGLYNDFRFSRCLYHTVLNRPANSDVHKLSSGQQILEPQHPPTKNLFQQTFPECLSLGWDDCRFQGRSAEVGHSAGGSSVGLMFMIPDPSWRRVAVGHAAWLFPALGLGSAGVAPSQDSGPWGPLSPRCLSPDPPRFP